MCWALAVAGHPIYLKSNGSSLLVWIFIFLKSPCLIIQKNLNDVMVRLKALHKGAGSARKRENVGFVPDKCCVKMIREGSHGPIAENKRSDALCASAARLFFVSAPGTAVRLLFFLFLEKADFLITCSVLTIANLLSNFCCSSSTLGEDYE